MVDLFGTRPVILNIEEPSLRVPIVYNSAQRPIKYCPHQYRYIVE
jgi:hypothetical protein